jgi:hypothetical protein
VHNQDEAQLSLLERVDLALASRMVGDPAREELLAKAQLVLDTVRRPAPTDAEFIAALLRLRGFVIDDDDARAVFSGRPGRLSPIAQEHRLLGGLRECLRLVRKRASDGHAPDGWFMVDLFRALTAELPRFRNNELRQGPPWDSLMYVTYPAPDQLAPILDTFDAARSFRDVPTVFQRLHPVRQGFRILWRFARVAPFPDFNLVMAWLGMSAWLQAKGFPLLMPERGDQQLLVKLVGGPPPSKVLQFEGRLLHALDDAA